MSEEDPVQPQEKRPGSPRPLEVCAYCGASADLTTDHVIPLCLFVAPYPPHLITVKACFVCNQGKGHDDGLLRDILTSDIAGGQAPAAQIIFDSRVLKAVERNSSHLRKLAQELRKVDVVTPAGLVVGEAFHGSVPDGTLERILFRTVQGLFADRFKKLLPASSEVSVFRRLLTDLPEFAKSFGGGAKRRIGDIFWCSHLCDGKSGMDLWLLVFYERVIYTVVTAPAGTDMTFLTPPIVEP